MTAVRRGGRARTPAGDLVVWTQAEGARGTRWREAVERDGHLVRSLLLEVAPGGRATRLELTTRAGLLTLHPEPDDSALHGNVVGRDGVRHLAFEWGPRHEVLVAGSPVSTAILIGRAGEAVPGRSTRDVDGLRVDDALEPRLVRWTVERASDEAWLVREIDGEGEWRVTLGEDGLPRFADHATWPLEE